MAGREIETLIGLLARLPGLGPRSARRATLSLLDKRESLLRPLAAALEAAADRIAACQICGNLDSIDPCAICADPARAESPLCVVAEIGDLWALERAGAFAGRYHVLGGTLSALDGVTPDDLRIEALVRRVREGRVAEVILALGATVDGQATAHYVSDRLAGTGAAITRLGHGLPMGGELHYLDDGTLAAALKARRPA